MDVKKYGGQEKPPRAAVNECVALLRRRLCGGVTEPLQSLPLLPDAERNRR